MPLGLPAIAVLLTAATVVASPPASAQTYPDLNRFVVETVARPAYGELADRSDALAGSLARFCAEGGPDRHATAVTAYGDALDAWGRAQTVRFGPAFEGERAARIQFWPDRHGTAQRQIRRVLASEDEAVLDPAALAGKSVGLQGLPAIERVLIDILAKEHDPFACDYVLSAARSLADLTRQVALEWQGYGREVLSAGREGELFFSPFDPATLILRGVIDTLDVIVQQKLERPLGDDLEGARPRSAETWRTNRSIAPIEASLAVAETITVRDQGLLDLLAASGAQTDLDARLPETFRRARETSAGLGMPLEEAVEDPAARPAVQDLVDQVKSLRAMLATELGPAVGIGIGFNALDGD